jgi:hypothetical protein
VLLDESAEAHAALAEDYFFRGSVDREAVALILKGLPITPRSSPRSTRCGLRDASHPSRESDSRRVGHRRLNDYRAVAGRPGQRTEGLPYRGIPQGIRRRQHSTARTPVGRLTPVSPDGPTSTCPSC